MLILGALSRAPAVDFIRGDANGDGRVNFSDVALLLLAERIEDLTFPCLDAADANDDGLVGDFPGIGDDARRLQDWLVGQWIRPGDVPNLRAPFPRPGPDPTADRLSCLEASGRPPVAREGRRFRWDGPRRISPHEESFEAFLEVDTDQPILGLSLVYAVNLAAISITGVDLAGTSFPARLREDFERSELFRWELVSESEFPVGLLHVQALFVDNRGRPIEFAATEARGARIPILRIRGVTRGRESDEPVAVLVPFTAEYSGPAGLVGGARNAFVSVAAGGPFRLPGSDLPIFEEDLETLLPILAGPEEVVFLRGDANTDSMVDIGDAVYTLSFLFSGGPFPDADDAADANDDGVLNLADPVYTLGSLFLGGQTFPAPYPNCGLDLTADTLSCCAYSACAE